VPFNLHFRRLKFPKIEKIFVIFPVRGNAAERKAGIEKYFKTSVGSVGGMQIAPGTQNPTLSSHSARRRKTLSKISELYLLVCDF
jgi:hypothetical protein